MSSIHAQVESAYLELVRNDGYALKYVKKQTAKICLETVKNDTTNA